MNQRNVEALTRILMDTADARLTYEQRAERLAAHGVLVPSVLTPPDNWKLNKCAAVVGEHGAVISLEALVAELEQIAKGEV